ncbi:hypothetical protein V6Z12_A09G003700 [Gossypium hirsutum]
MSFKWLVWNVAVDLKLQVWLTMQSVVARCM